MFRVMRTAGGQVKCIRGGRLELRGARDNRDRCESLGGRRTPRRIRTAKKKISLFFSPLLRILDTGLGDSECHIHNTDSRIHRDDSDYTIA
jgi:hypothetical protein